MKMFPSLITYNTFLCLLCRFRNIKIIVMKIMYLYFSYSTSILLFTNSNFTAPTSGPPTSQINASASLPQYISSIPVASDYLECRRVASRKRCVPISVRPGGTSLSRSPWGSKVSRPRVPCSKASPILRRAFWTRNVREVSRKRRPAKVAHLRRIGDGIYISRRSEYHRTRIL